MNARVRVSFVAKVVIMGVLLVPVTISGACEFSGPGIACANW